MQGKVKPDHLNYYSLSMFPIFSCHQLSALVALYCVNPSTTLLGFIFLLPLAISDTYLTYYQENVGENISKKKDFLHADKNVSPHKK